MKALVVLFVGGAVVLLGGLWFYNPFNWGTTRSPGFSVAAFRGVEQGDNLNRVVELLGPPIAVSESPDPSCEPKPCMNSLFAGEPVAPWVLGYAKAWVTSDADGLVRSTTWYEEP